jgi:hypothetical protein
LQSVWSISGSLSILWGPSVAWNLYVRRSENVSNVRSDAGIAGVRGARKVMSWKFTKCSIKDCNEEVSVSGRCVGHRVVFHVGDEVTVARTKKVHTVTAARSPTSSPASSYVLDNGTAYWDFELESPGLAK